MTATTTTLKTRTGEDRTVKHLDPLFCRMDGCRVRFSRVEPDGMVEVCDNAGRVLPDLRHPSFLLAY